jgi:hypothetical protein
LFHSELSQRNPLKHLSGPQSQNFTSWLLLGEHPQAPIRHEFGKFPVALQQRDVLTVPPEKEQPHFLSADK